MPAPNTGSLLEQDKMSQLFHQRCNYITRQRTHFILMEISVPVINSPLPSSYIDMRIWNDITNCCLGAVAFGEYLCQVADPSCQNNKSLAFFINCLKISYHRRITSFEQQADFHWVKSPTQYLTIPAKRKNAVLHQKLIVCFWYQQFRLVKTFGNYGVHK